MDRDPPAFPRPGTSFREGAEGMSLSDWFAGQALAGLMADPDMNADPEPVAEACYTYAAAMLAERAKADPK